MGFVPVNAKRYLAELVEAITVVGLAGNTVPAT
jgi:hypothetical protein